MSLSSLGRDLPRAGEAAVAFEKAVHPAKTLTGKTGLDALTKFIPTELLAPYVAVLSVAETQDWGAGKIYFWFIVATPIVFLLFEYAGSAVEDRPWPSFTPLIWRGIAATIAFGVWGIAAPTNPLQGLIGGAAVAGLAAMLVSPVLTAADAIVLRLLRE